jgi:hypothetical protein
MPHLFRRFITKRVGHERILARLGRIEYTLGNMPERIWQRNSQVSNQPPRRNNGKQGKCGLDRFTQGRQMHNLDGNGRAEQRELLFRHAV